MYDTTRSINDYDIPCAHADLDLNSVRIEYSAYGDNEANEDYEDVEMKQPLIEDTSVVSEKEDDSISFSNAAISPEKQNSLNVLLFKVAFKRPGRFEEIFEKTFETYSIGEIRDLLIAYQDEIFEANFIMLINMLTKQMNEGENEWAKV